MSARIAPEPISPATAVPDLRTRTAPSEPGGVPVVGDAGKTTHQDLQPGERFADVLPPLPAPPDPPGTMFAAALVSGALSPRPETPQELLLRLGTSWSPPDSDLRLADRKI
jgi:hypothetical protein